jgi:Holliday junction resolvase
MSAFQTLVKNKLKKQGFTVLKIIKLSDSGYPDLLALKEGKSIWVEVKESNDNLKKLQKMRIDQLISDGFIAFCIQKNKGIIYPKNFYYNIDL